MGEGTRKIAVGLAEEGVWSPGMGEAMNSMILRSSRVVTPEGMKPAEVVVKDGRIVDVCDPGQASTTSEEVDDV